MTEKIECFFCDHRLQIKKTGKYIVEPSPLPAPDPSHRGGTFLGKARSKVLNLCDVHRDGLKKDGYAVKRAGE